MNGITLCTATHDCRRIDGHNGACSATPTEAWAFMQAEDRDKLNKAGFATPRGGDKGGYQNHVDRSNKVVIPYERVEDSPLGEFENGYVIRLFPEQYFESQGVVRAEFTQANSQFVVGQNAFVLYRTHDQFASLPPLPGWAIRSLVRNGQPVQRRGEGVQDVGHYICRIPTLGALAARKEGPPQGIFAPEYATDEANYLSRCVLAWLIIHTLDSPYTTLQGRHIRAILDREGLLNEDYLEGAGVIRGGRTTCPLCLRYLPYDDLHNILEFDEADGLLNAAEQVEGATRSRVINLFHLRAFRYSTLEHLPQNVAWGHSHCNTRLGQRDCVTLAELRAAGLKVGVITEAGVETFGWINEEMTFIRSAEGAVWIQISTDGDLESNLPEEPVVVEPDVVGGNQ